MDPTRFDLFTRSLSRRPDGRPSRRSLLQAIAASLLASGFAPLAEIEAKGKRRRRNRKGRKDRRPCLTGQKRCKGRCAGCCNDADCGGKSCEIGVCADCPNGQRLCRGGCIAEDACCNDGECMGGRICVDGACACAADERLCEGTCIPVDACCGADCPIETCSPENCNGCCDGTTCRTGDSNNFCGRNGVACVACTQGESCDAGQCLGGGGTCSPETCSGCCDGNTCREGDSQNFCGRNGVECVQCAAGETCDAGACICATNVGCTDGPGGLCRPAGTCVYPPDCIGFPDDVEDCPGSGESELCCSQTCNAALRVCLSSEAGGPCHDNFDCLSERCTFYICE